MRSLGFDAPDELMMDEHSVIVDIYKIIEPDPPEDEWGNPLPPQTHYFVQNAEADLQPKSGSERAAESGTTYESTHGLILTVTDEKIPVGATVDVKSEAGGDVLSTFTVVFPADHGTHLEVDLKAA